MPPELAGLGFKALRVFHNDLTDGWAYLAESEALIVLAYRPLTGIPIAKPAWCIQPTPTHVCACIKDFIAPSKGYLMEKKASESK